MIDKIKSKKILLNLSNILGISGREGNVATQIKSELETSSEVDDFGNLTVQLGSGNKKIGLFAHMDEIGFFVKNIDEKGFVYFHPLGSWWAHIPLGQKVYVVSRKTGKKYVGTIGTTPAGNKTGNAIIPISEMYVDLGAMNKSDINAIKIEPGDMVIPFSEATELLNSDFLMGKAMDDRIGCTTVINVMNEITNKNLSKITVNGNFTAQEEVGTRGSLVLGRKQRNDINIVIDVATAKDTPQAANYINRELNAGPGLVLFDKTSIPDMKLLDRIKDIAEENNIPFQYDMLAGGGTDAGSVQMIDGKPTLVLCIPVRYCHSWNSVVSINDSINTSKLIIELINMLEKE